MKSRVSVVWFRHDLRLSDNPALTAALLHSESAVPVYIWCPDEDGAWTPGAASRWWLHHSLERLDKDLMKLRSRLIIRAGDSLSELEAIVEATGADAVFYNRRYDPSGTICDAQVRAALESRGVYVETFNASLLHEPEQIATKNGKRFRVFTPFWNNISQQLQVSELPSRPRRIPLPQSRVDSLLLAQLNLLPKIDWAKGIREIWTPGEAGAHVRLTHFLGGAYRHYSDNRNRPDLDGVSMLSPHLHFGEISVQQICAELMKLKPRNVRERASIADFRKELGWREFAHYVLYHYPHTSHRPLRAEFERMPNTGLDERLLSVWQRGLTGYPIVDAGMRQLWHTGWMHNRVRMVVGSFLTKDLLANWLEGARWFWDTLVDADLANNTLGWQWVAGCGADAAPYYRIFNPELQGERSDPDGQYVRQWVPEIAQLPTKWIHTPWKAPPTVLNTAGVELGRNYPERIIDHSWARRRALDAFAGLGG